MTSEKSCGRSNSIESIDRSMPSVEHMHAALNRIKNIIKREKRK